MGVFKWFGTHLKFLPLCVRACVRACVRVCTHTDQVLCVELVLGFWSDQSETYTYWKYMGWSFAPFLGGDVDSPVCLWEASELRSPQHLTNPSDFFQSFVLNSSKGFGRINLKPIQIEYIWVEVVDISLGVMSIRPFVCERCRNLGPHSILLIRVFFSNVLSWTCPGVLVGSIWNLYRFFYIWVGVVHLSLGAASHHPFFCERSRNLAPHSVLMT